jgi:hypothetical protein
MENSIKYKGKFYSIEHDGDASYFLNYLFDNVTFISNHRDYSDKGPLSHFQVEHITDNELPENIEAVPITAYIHGGIALSLSNSEYPFNCRFDSGVFGFLLFEKGEFGENNRGLPGFIRAFNALLMNEVYWIGSYEIDTWKSSKGEIREEKGEIIDSIGGFYGYESNGEMIDSMLEHLELSDKDKENVKHLLLNS